MCGVVVIRYKAADLCLQSAQFGGFHRLRAFVWFTHPGRCNGSGFFAVQAAAVSRRFSPCTSRVRAKAPRVVFI